MSAARRFPVRIGRALIVYHHHEESFAYMMIPCLWDLPRRSSIFLWNLGNDDITRSPCTTILDRRTTATRLMEPLQDP